MRRYAKIDGSGFHVEDGDNISSVLNAWGQPSIRIIHELSQRATKLEEITSKMGFLHVYSDADIEEAIYTEDDLISLLLDDDTWYKIGELFRDYQGQLKQELIVLRDNNE